CRFGHAGNYFLEASGIYGLGCPDCTYQVRISPHGGTFVAGARDLQPEPEWTERSFSRKLNGWRKAVATRSVKEADQPSTGAKIVAANQARGKGSSAGP